VPDPSFEEFVRANLAVLGRYAYALTGNRHAAEDLVQDTLVRLATAWRRVRADGNPQAYARTAMFRLYVSRWRALRRRPADELPELPDPRSGFADVETRDALRRVLASLPRAQRAVLVATYLDDAPDEVIARLLGRQPTTVRSLRLRALRALRARFDADRGTEVRHGGL
jgi:RNA polymerase sigma-70 factor (sigma-E family)